MLGKTHSDFSKHWNRLENGSEVAVSTNYFSSSFVTNMYRIKNLRSGGISTTGEPSSIQKPRKRRQTGTNPAPMRCLLFPILHGVVSGGGRSSDVPVRFLMLLDV
jgi:hypothetical protein